MMLVTEDSEQDFGELAAGRAVGFAVAGPRGGERTTTLPIIVEAPPRGSFDRPTIAAFLRVQDNAPAILAQLLSACPDKAIGGGRRLWLWSWTSTDNAQWIAAISYLLEDARAREMSFFM